MMQFQEHGQFKLTIEDRIVVVDAEGPFDVLLFKRYDHEMHQAIEHFNNQRWANIAVLHGLTIFIPDVFTLLNEHLNWRIQNNFVAEALVLVEPEGANILESQLHEVYHRLKIDFQYFDSVPAAREWATSKF
ncbi:hypothetical protein [Neptunicella marina]|uniref:Uncharacterized protein n=1 Tax=Neptunicella marina TaxID=2125989 RepID=A0A8J6ITN6_9ALTE|nr:hypothetical protein [Neptunicella marina]MBC3765208.1 hypothetical protein [Neptunicella marina]